MTKAANQMVVGTTIAIVSEALVLAAKAGVDPAKVRQALLGGFAQSKILEAHGQKMLDRNFKPGFRIRLHEKDMKIALSTGSEYGVPLMVTSQVAQMMTAMKSMGNGDLDHSGLVKFVEELAKTGINSETRKLNHGFQPARLQLLIGFQCEAKVVGLCSRDGFIGVDDLANDVEIVSLYFLIDKPVSRKRPDEVIVNASGLLA